MSFGMSQGKSFDSAGAWSSTCKSSPGAIHITRPLICTSSTPIQFLNLTSMVIASSCTMLSNPDDSLVCDAASILSDSGLMTSYSRNNPSLRWTARSPPHNVLLLRFGERYTSSAFRNKNSASPINVQHHFYCVTFVVIGGQSLYQRRNFGLLSLLLRLKGEGKQIGGIS